MVFLWNVQLELGGGLLSRVGLPLLPSVADSD